MDAIETYALSDGTRLKIQYDEMADDPRNMDNIGKFCIMKHRNYTFPNELDFDFGDSYYDDDDTAENRMKELEKTHHIFWIDMYEHSGIVFSFSGRGTNCKFDTSKDCGFIAVPMGVDKITGYECKGYDDATRIAKQELKEYNAFCNGETYGWVQEKEYTYTREDGIVKKEREQIDSCRGYYELEDMLSEFKSLNPKKI